MSSDNEPITRGELDQYVAQINAQMRKVVREELHKSAPPPNPAPPRQDASWAVVQQLQAEMRERDRRQMEELRQELRDLRNAPAPDPLEELEHARALVAAAGPAEDSEMMKALSVLSPVAEALIERSHQPTPSDPPPSPSNEEPGAEESHAETDPYHSAEHFGPGLESAPGGPVVIVAEPGPLS